jgi:hypothetical protein
MDRTNTNIMVAPAWCQVCNTQFTSGVGLLHHAMNSHRRVVKPLSGNRFLLFTLDRGCVVVPNRSDVIRWLLSREFLDACAMLAVVDLAGAEHGGCDEPQD